jgi:hypothetical protein
VKKFKNLDDLFNNEESNELVKQYFDLQWSLSHQDRSSNTNTGGLTGWLTKAITLCNKIQAWDLLFCCLLLQVAVRGSELVQEMGCEAVLEYMAIKLYQILVDQRFNSPVQGPAASPAATGNGCEALGTGSGSVDRVPEVKQVVEHSPDAISKALAPSNGAFCTSAEPNQQPLSSDIAATVGSDVEGVVSGKFTSWLQSIAQILSRSKTEAAGSVGENSAGAGTSASQDDALDMDRRHLYRAALGKGTPFSLPANLQTPELDALASKLFSNTAVGMLLSWPLHIT